MRGRSPLLRYTKRGGAAACVVTLLAYAMTAIWHNVGMNSGQNYAVQLGGGAVAFFWVKQSLPDFIPLTAQSPRWWVYTVAGRRGMFHHNWSEHAWWPKSYFQAGMRWVTIPLWIPLAAFAIPSGLLFYLDRRRFPPGHCRRCGYDLTGNVSGVCPECGSRV